jgi:hypothetical protein
MRDAIARCLGVSSSAVNVKATTNERFGSLGSGEALAAIAAVSHFTLTTRPAATVSTWRPQQLPNSATSWASASRTSAYWPASNSLTAFSR